MEKYKGLILVLWGYANGILATNGPWEGTPTIQWTAFGLFLLSCGLNGWYSVKWWRERRV